MKKLFSVIATGSLLTLMVVVAHAQLPGIPIRASIPFDFNVRGRMLPAGNYEITRINDEPEGLMIRNVDHRRDKALFRTEPIDVAGSSRKNVLVFHRYGDSYFLSEVETAGEQTGQELTPSRAERQLRHEMETARGQSAVETVTVAAN